MAKTKITNWATIASRVQLLDVRLIKNSSELKPEALTGGPLDYQIDKSTSVQFNPELELLQVFANYQLKVTSQDKTREAATLSASFLVTYRLSDFTDIKKGDFEEFAQLNGIYNTWPYWREFVQNMVTRMGLPSLSIPVFRLGEPANIKDKPVELEKLKPSKKLKNKSKSQATKKT